MREHIHDFKMTAHVDGCHWFTTTATCTCGAVFREEGERDIADDPYALAWLDDTGECKRCHELLSGAAPDFSTEVVLP